MSEIRTPPDDGSLEHATTTVGARLESAEQVPTHVERVGSEHLDVVHEHHAVDVRPAIEWDRGACVDALLDGAPDGSLPVYLGADETDRPAFRAVERHDGVSVGVGCDGAQIRLDGPEDSVAFLRWLADSRFRQGRIDATAHRPHSA